MDATADTSTRVSDAATDVRGLAFGRLARRDDASPGARDSLFDLRQCDMRGKSADGFDLSGAILSEADFSDASPCPARKPFS